ncbi:MAG: rhomboid family intramembrane serine protease [Tannerella sp.]|jgi:membrane associated rhomboid family serine protease|nr:rhomboid family intramembrane serine protease [Tannerella sp.]
MDSDKKDTITAFIYAFSLLSFPWIVYLTELLTNTKFTHFGLHPLEWKGLIGIITLPLLHDGVNHLMSNTPSLFLLLFGLFLFYRNKSWLILLYLYLTCGLMTWFMGRTFSIHVGASGLVYALAAFHFVSGVIRKVPRQMAFALLVAFLYGGFIWAFFPSLYKDTAISWEGHLSGMITGIAFAFYFRRTGPPPPIDPFLTDEDDNKEDTYWEITEQEEQEQSMQ